MTKTKIEWCDCTINPVVGCTRGCDYCYARKINERFHFVSDFSKPQFFEKRLQELGKVKNKIVFVNSMSDFGDWEYFQMEKLNDIIKSDNIYILLSKKHYLFNFRKKCFIENSKDYFFIPHKNVFQGFTFDKIREKTSIRMKNTKIPYHEDFTHHNVFLNFEPLLEDVADSIPAEFLKQMKWCIVGGETGNRKGKVIPKREWVEKIIDNCRECGVPVFVKDSITKLYGIDIKEYPQAIYKMGLRNEKF